MDIKDLISPVLVATISLVGILVQLKIAHDRLENDKDTTPPALSRLENISEILKDIEKYPDEIKKVLYSKGMFSAYKRILDQINIENEILRLGVYNVEVLEALKCIPVGQGLGEYPSPGWSISKYRKTNTALLYILYILMTLLFVFNLALAFLMVYVYREYVGSWLFVIYLLLTIGPAFLSLFMAISVYKTLSKDKQNIKHEVLENNIIFKNCYYALRDIFLVDGYELNKISDGQEEREEFKKTKEYKEWWDKVKKDHPQWTSWNYGLSISWDNDPDKAKTGESAPETPTDLAGSESTPEDPKWQEP